MSSMNRTSRATADASLDRFGRRQHLVGSRSYPDVISEVYPSYRSGWIKKKLGGPRDVLLLRTAGNVQQIVAANPLGVWIGEDREREPSPLNEIARNFRRIDADRNRLDAQRRKLTHMFLDTSQLEVAEWSPIAPVKDEQNCLGWVRSLSRSREQMRKRNGFSVAVDKRKGGSFLPDPRRSGRNREISRMKESKGRTARKNQTDYYEYGSEPLSAVPLGLRKRPPDAGDHDDQAGYRHYEVYPRESPLTRQVEKV